MAEAQGASYSLVPPMAQLRIPVVCGYIDKVTGGVQNLKQSRASGSRGGNCAKGRRRSTVTRSIESLSAKAAGERGKANGNATPWDAALNEIAARIRKGLSRTGATEICITGRPGEEVSPNAYSPPGVVDGHTSQRTLFLQKREGFTVDGT